jgi:predicted DNA-binding protein YlxM (UPF0122 family)
MDNIYLVSLYDYYSSLLTEKQQKYFEAYYFNNLSLSEIADNDLISRSAIHKQLKETENKLLFYEDKLNLYQKRIKLETIINSLDDKLKEEIKELI